MSNKRVWESKPRKSFRAKMGWLILFLIVIHAILGSLSIAYFFEAADLIPFGRGIVFLALKAVPSVGSAVNGQLLFHEAVSFGNLIKNIVYAIFYSSVFDILSKAALMFSGISEKPRKSIWLTRKVYIQSMIAVATVLIAPFALIIIDDLFMNKPVIIGLPESVKIVLALFIALFFSIIYVYFCCMVKRLSIFQSLKQLFIVKIGMQLLKMYFTFFTLLLLVIISKVKPGYVFLGLVLLYALLIVLNKFEEILEN